MKNRLQRRLLAGLPHAGGRPADPKAIRVDTPTATLGVRGTDFIVQVD